MAETGMSSRYRSSGYCARLGGGEGPGKNEPPVAMLSSSRAILSSLRVTEEESWVLKALRTTPDRTMLSMETAAAERISGKSTEKPGERRTSSRRPGSLDIREAKSASEE